MSAKWGLLVGVMVGVTVALMLAPKKGNVARRWARIRGGKLLKQAQEKLDQKI